MSFVEKANKFKTQSITVNGKSLEDAQIVIPVKYTSSEYRTAVYIQQHLSEYTGYRLPIVDDNTGVGENEILIGKTTRTKETPGFCEYMIGINGASLFLVAGNTYAYDKALTVFKENIVPLNNKAIELKMPSGGFLAREDIRSTLGNGTENILEHKGDLRIMSLNIWGYTKEKDGKQLEQRNMQNAEGILTYLPDIIGLQECSPAACSGEKSIVNLLSDVFAQVPVTVSNPYNTNYTPLLYREETMNLVEGGYHLYSGLNDSDSKSVTWGVFRVNATGKVFAAASTHLWWQSGMESDEAREQQANELDALVKQIREKYSCDFFVFGDLNSTSAGKGCGTLLSKGYISAQLDAEETEMTKTHHSYPVYDTNLGLWTGFTPPDSKSDRSIDHILLSGSSTFLVFDVVTDRLALLSSDHSPIYTDIRL